jgi:protein-disulfide isomerase
MDSRVDRIISMATLVCAIGAVAIAASNRKSNTAPPPLEKPASVFVADWEVVSNRGMFIGSPTAPIVVTEFTDYQCPFCREFQKTLMSMKRRFGDSIAISIVHFPLPMHREARAAAKIAQCAHAQSLGGHMTDFLFLHQDSIGRQSSSWFAIAAKVPDTTKFASCISDPASDSAVERGYQSAKRLGLSGTPTVMINGWRYGGVPTDSTLYADVEALLRGEEPHKGMRKRRVP